MTRYACAMLALCLIVYREPYARGHVIIAQQQGRDGRLPLAPPLLAGEGPGGEVRGWRADPSRPLATLPYEERARAAIEADGDG